MNDSVLSKVRALLATAATTKFPDEAEAFQAKAVLLMQKHSVDQAMLDATDPSRKEAVVAMVLEVPAPFLKARAHLLHVVARNHSCRAVSLFKSKGSKVQQVTVVGHETDVEFVERLFTALLLHANGVMLNTPTPAYQNTKAFRQAFLLEYAGRISERLKAAKSAAIKTHGGTGVALAIQDREGEVAGEFRQRFPNTTQWSTSTRGNAGGRGSNAANSADLGQSQMKGRIAIGG